MTTRVEDAAALLRARRADIDLAYVETWVRELGLETQWEAARAAASLDAD